MAGRATGKVRGQVSNSAARTGRIVPELPEVETVKRGLDPILTGRRLKRLETRRADLRFPFATDLAARLESRKIISLQRRAKYLLVTFEGGDTLLMHLGMTGRFTIEDKQGAEALGQYVYDEGGDPKHDHVVFHLSGGAKVIYNDARRFGFMVLLAQSEMDTHPLLKGLGPEPLGEEFTPAYLATRAAGKKVNLKALLMDQRVVAGLGNIYVCEALFRAQLSPDRAASTLANAKGLPVQRTHALVASIKDVLRDAILAGGSTLRDYRQADGSSGSFQERFLVYGREGEPCSRPGCRGRVHRTVHSGRSTFYCPVCQR